MPTPRRPLRLLLVPAMALGSLLVGCSGTNPFQQTATTVAADVTAPTGTGLANNDFMPEKNLSSCINTNERPGCGSTSKGGWRMYLVFAALIAGVGFVMWRVARSVRQRDQVVNAE